jgi:hypothetical protein
MGPLLLGTLEGRLFAGRFARAHALEPDHVVGWLWRPLLMPFDSNIEIDRRLSHLCPLSTPTGDVILFVPMLSSHAVTSHYRARAVPA